MGMVPYRTTSKITNARLQQWIGSWGKMKGGNNTGFQF